MATANRASVLDYMERLRKYVYPGIELIHLEGSLYQVGPEQALIQATKPKTDGYLFGVNAALLPKAAHVTLICANDLCAFKIPAELLLKLVPELHTDPKTGRYLLHIEYDDQGHYWRMGLRKSGKGPARLDIDAYRVEMASQEERMGMALQLRKLLYNM